MRLYPTLEYGTPSRTMSEWISILLTIKAVYSKECRLDRFDALATGHQKVCLWGPLAATFIH